MLKMPESENIVEAAFLNPFNVLEKQP